MEASSVSGFPPVIDKSARCLILGSAPGRVSLGAREYYAQPRNAFWRIMGALFGAGPEKPYSQRLEILKQRGIALWDVLEKCHRPGSLDASIDDSTAQPNNFCNFYRSHRSIRRVFFNGGKAASLYRSRVLQFVVLDAPYLSHVRLPSTSPAYAAMTFEEKLHRWLVIGDASR